MQNSSKTQESNFRLVFGCICPMPDQSLGVFQKNLKADKKLVKKLVKKVVKKFLKKLALNY